MRSRVYKSTGSWYTVKSEDGDFFNARIKGILRLDGITSTNPIAVGDWIEMEPEETADQTMIITQIYDRHNYVARSSPQQNRERHIVASNLDQAMLIATLKEPKTSTGFIDRFLISCEANHIPAQIILNKTDIYRDQEIATAESIKTIYETLGYPVHFVSLKLQDGADAVLRLLKDKTTLISGPSGVGKSTFINLALPGSDIKTKEVSNWSGKGMHTTTFAEMYDLPGGGSIIDTPGLREFGITDLDKRELSHYFPEMRKILQQCQFNNCIHINEPGCAVLLSVQNDAIAKERYRSYCNILESITDNRY